MKTTLKRIQASDGIELVGLLYEPEIQSKKIMVLVHGMAGNFYENKFFSVLPEILTQNGIAFCAFNNRGCEVVKDLTKTVDGKKSFVRIGNAYEKFEECIYDIKAVIDEVLKLGYDSIHLGGHSLGSPKVVFYISETGDTRVKSAMLLSPADMQGLEKQNEKRYKENILTAENMVKEGKGSQILPQQVWDEYPLSAATYLSLFAEDAKTNVVNFHNPSVSLDAIGKIKQPLITIMGRKDDALVTPIEQTMEKIQKAAVASSKVESCILGDANHGYTGDEEKLAEVVKEWIQKQ